MEVWCRGQEEVSLPHGAADLTRHPVKRGGLPVPVMSTRLDSRNCPMLCCVWAWASGDHRPKLNICWYICWYHLTYPKNLQWFQICSTPATSTTFPSFNVLLEWIELENKGRLNDIQELPLFSDEARPTLKLFLMVPTPWPGSGVLTKPMNQCLTLR